MILPASPNVEAIAQATVRRYQQRRARGDLRVDHQLIFELREALPDKEAQEVFDRFRKRRSRSDPKADDLLVVEIGVVLHDAEHHRQNFKPIMPKQPEEPDRTPPRAANTCRKVIEGLPLTGADEDALLFGDLCLGTCWAMNNLVTIGHGIGGSAKRFKKP